MILDESADEVMLWKNGNNVDEVHHQAGSRTGTGRNTSYTSKRPTVDEEYARLARDSKETRRTRGSSLESQAQRETGLRQELTSMREEMAAMRKLIEKQEQEALLEPVL